MFKNYLKIAARQLLVHKLYALINILGLGIGLACCLLILLFVRHEFSFENSFVNAGDIYRISREYYPFEGARARIPASNNAPVTPAMIQDFSADIETAGRIFGGNTLLESENLRLSEPEVRFADQAIVDMFNFQWLAGDASQALSQPGSMVLTESIAMKHFGSTDVLGRTLTVMDTVPMQITGVIADLPDNTHLSLTGLISLNTIPLAFGNEFLEVWNGSTDFHTYFLLRDGGSMSTIEAQIPAFLDRYAGENASELSTMQIMNIQNIHLHTNRDEEWKSPGNINTVYGFTGIAFLVLLIACINFMSISTARSSRRAKEVGMRLSIGASRLELIIQFLGESLLTAGLAMAVAIVLVEVALPPFSNFVGTSFDFSYLEMGGILAALVMFVGIAAGSYPALFLSGFKAAKVLKGDVIRGKSGLLFRSLLVVFQFSIAIGILIATTVIYKQQQFATDFDMGFGKDDIVVLTSSGAQGYRDDWPRLKQELLNHPAIDGVTASHFLPFGFNDNQVPVSVIGSSVETRIQYMLVDFNFFSTYGINVIDGRAFQESLGIDSSEQATEDGTPAVSVIINASAARAMGIDPLASVNRQGELAGGQFVGNIVGVVEDTYFESIHRDVRPLMFILSPPQVPFIQRFRNAAIQINPQALPEALAHIDATWKSLYPDTEVNRHFLEADFQAMYRLENQQSRLFTWFSIFAVLIACFGLLGLAAFNAERRTKEIGVRKVMGSSVWQIVVLLSNDFSKLVLASNLIAWPVAYYFMSGWLENFAYRIDLTPLIFIGSGLIALCIAWVTVGGTAAKAASQKPVLALRYE